MWHDGSSFVLEQANAWYARAIAPGTRRFARSWSNPSSRAHAAGYSKKSLFPRCPQYKHPLSAPIASQYIESNAPGTKKGWRWQVNWHATYCIVIENREVQDNFKPT
jgi:hypothetical protein